MGQFQIRAKICVSKKRNKHSNQAQITGDFMCQKWRIYGLSDKLLELTYILINKVEIGHREQTKQLFVSSIFDGQFHETCHPFREIAVLQLPVLATHIRSENKCTSISP